MFDIEVMTERQCNELLWYLAVMCCEYDSKMITPYHASLAIEERF